VTAFARPPSASFFVASCARAVLGAEVSRHYVRLPTAPTSRGTCEGISAEYMFKLVVILGGEAQEPFARAGARAEKREVFFGASPLRRPARLKPRVALRGLRHETPTAKIGPPGKA